MDPKQPDRAFPAFDRVVNIDKALRSKVRAPHKDKHRPECPELAESEWSQCVGKGGGECSNCSCKIAAETVSREDPRALLIRGAACEHGLLKRYHHADVSDEDNREKQRQMFEIGDRQSCCQHDEGGDQEEIT